VKTLYTRLSLALVLIITTVGGGFFLVVRWSTQQYYEELTQRLNASIAMYVTGQSQLIADARVDREQLEQLARRAMVINPSVEVYLLDTTGRILDHGLPPGEVRLDRVALGPVQALIAGQSGFPLRGTDPRNPGREKVFSAAPVVADGVLQGYLYVVLGGRQYDELAASLRGSYVLSLSIGAISALVLGASMVGLLVFALLTRRLKRLNRAVQAYTASHGDPARRQMALVSLQQAPDSGAGSDEIGRLGDAFVDMARTIGEQFERMQEADRLRRELISNVSHDLRTPLATMHGYVDTLLLKNEELSPEERAHYLRIARKHTERLGKLIGDLFELSKLESGNLNLSLESFSLAELLHDVVQGFQLEARRRDIALELRTLPDTAQVRADIGLMQRVLENLIRNALDNTPRGGRVTLSLDAHPQHVAVSVADTGRGIPGDQIGFIFDRFYCTPGAGTVPGESTGLGLAIVKRILDLHGSRITVESRVNEGTRFEFHLPAARAA